MSPASWEVEREERMKAQRFKSLVKEMFDTSMSKIEFQDTVEKLYVKVYYEED